MKKILMKAGLLLLCTLVFNNADAALQAVGSDNGFKVRVKDVSRLKGDESYELVGYGVVTGLAGTGDSDKILIQRTVANLLQNFNIVVDEGDIKAKNLAAVMVTVTIKGNRSKGDLFTGQVSTAGDAESLQGGVLQLSPLLGPDGKVWATAQGPITLGGYSFGSSDAGGSQSVKNHPTTGVVTNGIKLVRDVGIDYTLAESLTYVLNDPDYTSAVNFAKTINKVLPGAAIVKNSAVIEVAIPNKYKDQNNIPGLISDIGQLVFATDNVAKVVFNERTGTLVIGENVKISRAAISHGNLFIQVKNTVGVSQPGAFAGGETVQVPNEETEVKEEKVPLVELQPTTTVKDVVDALNSLGVSSRDIMVIFHALKEAGALHAKLEAL